MAPGMGFEPVSSEGALIHLHCLILSCQVLASCENRGEDSITLGWFRGESLFSGKWDFSSSGTVERSDSKG